MKTKIRAFLMAAILLFSTARPAFAEEPDEYIDCKAQIQMLQMRMETDHVTAESLRAVGRNMSVAISILQSDYMGAYAELEGWKKLSKYTYEELDYATMLAYNEAPYCGDDHQQYVVAVLVNRTHDERFPNTFKKCLEAPMQYSKNYTNKTLIEKAKAKDPDEWLRCRTNAVAALREMTGMPEDVVYQSEFKDLGTGTWKVCHVDTGFYYSDTYFNYG